jgi:hypothetical protein
MKLSGLASLVAVALASSLAGFGCEDDVQTTKRDAAVRDATPDSPGTGGMGGSRDAAVDTGGSGGTADARVDTGAPDVPVDAPMPDAPPDTLPRDTASPDAALPDTAPPDTALPDTAPPDTALPDTAPPDTALPDTATSDAATVATSCSQVNCPAMLDVTNQCDGDDQTCTVQTVNADPETKNICFANMVKKVSTATDNGVTLVVRKPDGSPCYTLEVDSPDTADDTWIFKSPAGTILSEVNVPTAGPVILTCPSNGTRWDITLAGCAGMEGEGDACATGTCAIP